MKARGLIVIDYEFPGGFKEAAQEQARMEEALQEFVRGNPRIIFADCDIKERRGDARPDVHKMKIRTS